MHKTILGVSLLIILVGIMIGSSINNDEQTETNDFLPDTGGMIMPKEAEDFVGIQPGETAVDFELETLDGEMLRLSDLQGEKVILNFWASWCPPCREEMPEMQEFYEEYNEDIKIIAVNYNETDETVKDFIEEFNYTFTTPLDRNGAVGDNYGVLSLPTTYFIGTDGKIQEPRHVGPMDYEFMEDMMEKLN
ncbi:TlpA family protein disulfide reductase [Oceanobacillus sp. CAU 1775]